MVFRCGFTVLALRFYKSFVAVLQYSRCGFTTVRGASLGQHCEEYSTDFKSLIGWVLAF